MSENQQSNILQSTQLYPADIDEITDKYSHLFKNYDNLRERDSIFDRYKQTNNKLSILFPLKEHPVHGITGLEAYEKYENGLVTRYQYKWKIIIPKQGKLFSHISAWGNEPHSNPSTPEEFRVNTEPHHHHHIPGDWRQRQDNFDVHTLDAAFEFVERYIKTGIEYNP